MSTSQKLVWSFALSAVALLAQTAPAPAPAMVHLNVTLEKGGDAAGAPAPQDLQITDRGTAEHLLFVHRNGGELNAPAPGPSEYSNRSGKAAPHTTVLLFDLLNTVQSDQLTVWHNLRESLAQMESGDSLYFYLLNMEGALVPIHAIGAKTGDDHTWPQQIAGPFDKAMKAASHNRPAGVGDEEVVKKAYVAVESLANQMAPLPGVKNLVWITNGIPYIVDDRKPCSGDWVDCALYVPHLAVTLERDQVAIDTLSDSSTLNPDMNRDMEYIAGFTGGKTYFREDIRTVAKQVAMDAANSYSVYYVPGADYWDSKFHKISISSSKGLAVRTNQRYYAFPDSTPVAQKHQAALLAAYQSAMDESGVGVRVKESAGSAPKTVGLQIQVDPADIMMRENGGHYTGGINLVIGNFGASGAIGEPTIRSFDLNLTAEQHDAVMKASIPMSLDFALKDGAQKVKVIVQDQGTNAVGSVTAPVSAAPAH